MTASAPDTIVREILETALAAPIDAVENPARGEIEGWDSLTHIEIVFMLEEAFDVRFSEQEIIDMGTFRDIVETVQAKHAT